MGGAGREALRFEAADMLVLAAGMAADQVAARLRVSACSVRRWRAAVACGDESALASWVPGGVVCRLGRVRLEALEQALEQGSAARLGGGSALDVDAALGSHGDLGAFQGALHLARGVLSAAPHRLESPGAAACGGRA